MHRKRIDRLRKMMDGYSLARFESPLEAGLTRGYVLDVGRKWVLFLLVDDGCRFDGFACHRIADVKRPRPDPYAEFTATALRLRGEEVSAAPEVDLKDAAEILRSVSRISKMVAIHRELLRPDACWIGTVTKVKGGKCWLLGIGPDAVWEEEPTIFATADVTRVEWGGMYEEALALVGNQDIDAE